MYRLLLVDDEKAVLDGLLRAIAWDELGFETVDTAIDGNAAYALAQKNRYHVIISDIRMPGMDGLSLLKLLAEQGIKTRVIILTAYSEFDYVLSALRSGASNYLMKPIDVNELRASVIDALKYFGNDTRHDSQEQEMFEEYFLRRWLNDGADFSDLDTRASLIGVNIFLRSYNVMVLQSPANATLKLSQEITRRIQSLGDHWILREKPDMYVFIIGGRSVDVAALRKALLSMQDSITRSEARLFIGTSVSSYMDVSKCYQECALILRNHALQSGIWSAEDAVSLPAAEEKSPEKSAEHYSPIIRRALDYIAKQYALPLSLNQIANDLGLNANYLGFQFHREVGEYFSDYLNAFRIQHAQTLLRESDLSVAEISVKVGYTSVNYFCQVFKKQAHQSPAAYRRASIENA